MALSLRRFSVLLGLLAMLNGCASRPRPMSGERRAEHLASFDQVWSTIDRTYWDPKFNGVDWPAAKGELRGKVEVATTDRQARAAMNELLDRLKQSHFGIIPVEAYRRLEAIPGDNDQTADGESGIHLRVAQNRALVWKVEPGSPGAQAGVRPGYELLSAGKQSAAEVLEQVRKAHNGSSMLDTYLSMMANRLLAGNAGETVKARFLDPDGKKSTLTLTLAPRTGELSKFGNLPPYYIKFDAREAAPGIG